MNYCTFVIKLKPFWDPVVTFLLTLFNSTQVNTDQWTYLSSILFLDRNVRWKQPKTTSIAVQVDAKDIDSFGFSKDLPREVGNGIYGPANGVRNEGNGFYGPASDGAEDTVPFLRVNGSIPTSGFSGTSAGVFHLRISTYR